MITIRKIKSDDVKVILSLRLLWLSKQFDIHETTQLVRQWFSAYSNNPNAFAIIAEDNGQCVGYILCSLVRHPTMRGVSGEIDELRVTESYQRQGVGRRLVDKAREMFNGVTDELTTIIVKVDREELTVQKFWQAMDFEHDLLVYVDYLD